MSNCVCQSAQSLPSTIESERAVTETRGPSYNTLARSREERRGTAFHEAAHAVFATLAGGLVYSATIAPTSCSRGMVRWWSPAIGYGTLEKQALIFLAGPQAQSLVEQGFDPTESKVQFAFSDEFLPTIERMHADRPVTCCTNDDCCALHRLLYRRDHACAASLRMDYTRAGRTALQILKQDAVWKAVVIVAEALLAHETLDAAAVHDVMPSNLRNVPMFSLARDCTALLAPSLMYPPTDYPPVRV